MFVATRRRLLAAVLTILLGVMWMAPAAQAESAVQLPLQGFGSLVLDQAHGHLLMSDPVGGVVYVTDLAGAPVQTITGESGAGGMVLDGSTLYVPRCGAGAIDVIDTASLTVTDSISAAGIAGRRCNLAEAGGRLWYATGDDSTPLVSVTVAAPHARQVHAEMASVQGATYATSPTDPNLLVVAPMDTCPGGTISVYDVSASPVLKTSTEWAGCVMAMGVTSDGTGLVVVGSGMAAYNLSSLQVERTYPDPYGVAIAQSGDGTYLSVAERAGNSQVVDYRDGETAPFRTHPWRMAYDGVLNSLVMTADGHHMFSVGEEPGLGPFALSLLDGPAQIRPTLTITPSRTLVPFGGSVALTVHLSGHGTNGLVDIYRTVPGQAERLVATVAVGPGGSATFTARPAFNGTYRAVSAGDDLYVPARSTSHQVNVRVAATISQSGWYASSGAYRLYHRDNAAWFMAHISPNKHGHCVRFQLGIRRANGTWASLNSRCLSLSTTSSVRIGVRGMVVGQSYRMRVLYGGDALNLGGASTFAHFRAT
jgi:hypothetical protein